MRFPWISGVLTAAILVAMLTPSESIPTTGFKGSDIVVHVVIFALWALAVSLEFAAAPVTVLAVGFILAWVTELLQMLVPGRQFSLWDILSDTLGLAAGVALAFLVASRRAAQRAAGQDKSANSAWAAGESHASAD